MFSKRKSKSHLKRKVKHLSNEIDVLEKEKTALSKRAVLLEEGLELYRTFQKLRNLLGFSETDVVLWSNTTEDATEVVEDIKNFRRWNNLFLQRHPVRDNVEHYTQQHLTNLPILDRLDYYESKVDFSLNNREWLWKVFSWNAYHDKARQQQLLASRTVLEHHWKIFEESLWLRKGVDCKGRVFRVSNKLSATFAAADVPIPAESFHLPFPYVALAFPNDVTFSTQGVTVKLTHLYCTVEPEKNELSVLIAGVNRKNAYKEFVINVPLGKHPTLQKDIENYVEASERLAPESKAIMYQVLSFICNSMLYCTSFPQDVEPDMQEKMDALRKQIEKHPVGSQKRRKLQQKLQRYSDDKIYIVGKHFRFDDEEVRKRVESGRTLMSRHIVRGHWRNQVCGPRNQDRKMIFVQPFYRGSGEEGIKKTYVVK
jgi:hypothetical protein